MRGLLIAAVAMGCHGGRAPARPLPTRTPYLMLFERGRSWTLPAPGVPPVKCAVTDVKPVGDANVAHLDCGALLVSGTWVATPAGLYHPYVPVDDPDELALLGEDDLLIGAVPREREHEHVLEGGARSTIQAFGFDASWCVRETTSAGADSRMYLLCFDGRDVTGGGDETSTERTYFGAVPRDDASYDE
jgi:hypothetical protein